MKKIGPLESILIKINKIGIEKLFTNLFGKPFYDINQPYFTLIGDYLVFGNSENAIKSYINKIVTEKTLGNDENFIVFKDNLSSSSSIFIYNNIARSVNLYPRFLADDFANSTLEKINVQYRKAIKDVGLYDGSHLIQPFKISPSFWQYFVDINERWFLAACFI